MMQGGSEFPPLTEYVQGTRHKEIHLVHWFRKGLRLHDNPALKSALAGASTWRCVYIIDTWFASSNREGIVKWRFLLQCLHDLDTRLRRLNSRLFVIRGQPASVFPKIFQQWKVNRLSFEVDPEPYAKQRDAVICTLAERHGVEVITKSSHTLYDLKEFLQRNYGVAPLTYKKFQIYLQKLNLPNRPVDPISEEDIRGVTSSVSADHDEVYQIPTLQELGFARDTTEKLVWQGGETEALLRFDRHLERKAWVASFEKPTMTVNCLMANSTSISPYLRFGCLSPRLFFWRVTELYRSLNKRVDCPMSLHGQLLWREFFYLQATNNPKFDCMKGNPVCVQVPWDNNPEALAKWREGQTGFPWIDAVMAQLRQEGWIHHIAWHSVACFLTHGCLWASWEEGMKVFDELCLDADWSFNAGMWQWLSFSSFFQKFYRSYCPATFGQRIDPNGDYIRKYVPILDGYPNSYIFKPWTAPKEVQVAAKCVVGKDYPRPMVAHRQARSTNLERMKQVYRHLLSRGGPLRKYARKQLCVMIEQMEEAGTD